MVYNSKNDGSWAIYLVGGSVYPSEKYDLVNWDDDIPNIWKNKLHVPNHQLDMCSNQKNVD